MATTTDPQAPEEHDQLYEHDTESEDELEPESVPFLSSASGEQPRRSSTQKHRIEVFLLASKDDRKLRQLDQRPQPGPRLRFIYPYDAGVFMYASFDTSIPRVSNIQAYLDLYAQGGRDLKQADYLLDTAIEPRWKAA